MNQPWNAGTQSYTGTTTTRGSNPVQVPGASGTLTVTGSASGLGSVTYCGVASTGQTAQYTDNGDNTGTLVFNVMLPTGPNQNNQNWRFNGAFNGNVSPVTITGNGNQSAQYGVGDDTDDWQATGG